MIIFYIIINWFGTNIMSFPHIFSLGCIANILAFNNSIVGVGDLNPKLFH